MCPWGPSDAHGKTHKAKSAKSRKQWSKVANSVLARTGSDKQAIRTANGVIARKLYGGKK
jgi:hypothetical protein